ncbi:hypothetical protein GGP41_008572 [Bipolaris sorokiniana]|uniref:Uncharacterized protein n=2 Tax=Cochliobolus sativus TaxID=45130 RepID=A0A8H5ZD81_COCSA|nr:uncharacterized protein COCSADRAFT_175489 [Bipolaris sorokiniana ND90Pr]EMD59645.1 hypothetical protein COCSADRAFT_175489 [Bipolaris sorokiniana ND90Pr]KAF5846094.1 hypothetical protein GGP41_008572 [Bipolaris sorokiniana]
MLPPFYTTGVTCQHTKCPCLPAATDHGLQPTPLSCRTSPEVRPSTSPPHGATALPVLSSRSCLTTLSDKLCPRASHHRVLPNTFINLSRLLQRRINAHRLSWELDLRPLLPRNRTTRLVAACQDPLSPPNDRRYQQGHGKGAIQAWKLGGICPKLVMEQALGPLLP